MKPRRGMTMTAPKMDSSNDSRSDSNQSNSSHTQSKCENDNSADEPPRKKQRLMKTKV